MKAMKLILMSLFLTGVAQAQSGNADSLDELLQSVKRGQAESHAINAEREKRFVQYRSEQKGLLTEATRQAKKLEKQSDGLRKRFTKNEKTIKELRAKLAESSGDLEQLGTVFRQAAGDAQSLLSDSLVSSELPDRLQVLAELSRTDGIPAPEDIESLWYELQREMTENGRISRFKGEYYDANGEPVSARITRYGLFAAKADEQYLRYRSESTRLETLPRQPGGLKLFDEGDTVLIDPTRGTLFGLLIAKPSLLERLEQGGVVGVIILTLGGIGVLIAFFQLLFLMVQGGRIRRQRKTLHEPSEKNALGRVLLAARSAGDQKDMETLELALDEAILKEMPKLERLQGILKLLAAVAPLLGLLGTVTGMIETFQAITLFGTGDPKLMASGISQALMTTVLGLVVAVPLLFLHSLVTARSRVLVQILDEQSAGLIARRQEQQERVTAESQYA